MKCFMFQFDPVSIPTEENFMLLCTLIAVFLQVKKFANLKLSFPSKEYVNKFLNMPITQGRKQKNQIMQSQNFMSCKFH